MTNWLMIDDRLFAPIMLATTDVISLIEIEPDLSVSAARSSWCTFRSSGVLMSSGDANIEILSDFVRSSTDTSSIGCSGLAPEGRNERWTLLLSSSSVCDCDRGTERSCTREDMPP